MSKLLLVLGIVLFISLVVVHEFGHFIVAKRNGVEPEEFGIFFPPKLWGHKTKSGWLFSINLLPLGGFVKLKGEYDAAKGKGTYGAAKLGVKAKILLAGVGMNLLAAFVLLTLLGWLGMPQLISNQFNIKSDTHVIKNEVLVGEIENPSPAEKIGLKSGDRLLAITNPSGKKVNITSSNQLIDITKNYAGETVTVEYSRSGNVHEAQTTFRSKNVVEASLKTNNPKGYLGVVPEANYSLTRSTWSAPINALGLMVQFTALTFHGIGVAIHGLGSIIAAAVTGNHAAREAGQTQASNQVAGPVGVVKILNNGSILGYQFVLMVIAVISLSLALINVLPIPPLDGGKLFMTVVARLRHKKLTERVEALASGIGFAFFFLLIILITIADVRR